MNYSPAVVGNEPIIRLFIIYYNIIIIIDWNSHVLLTMAISDVVTWSFWRFACSQYVLMYSPDRTNVSGVVESLRG